MELAEITAEKDKAEQRIKALNADLNRLTAAVNKIEPFNAFSAFKRNFMLLPIINASIRPSAFNRTGCRDWKSISAG